MTDSTYLLEALSLAHHGLGNCAPNPAVGVVIVANGQVIGRGFHSGPGMPHAEVEAIRAVSDDQLAGATLYCTLEPCCHFGRTPPCTDLIIEKKIGRVVYGQIDPNPIVGGKGHSKLLAAGVKVDFLPLELIEDFYKSYRLWTTKRQPFTTFKVAMSLNGKIAGPYGQPLDITHQETFEWTHQGRKRSDAILTTVETIRNDDPQFTVRLARGEERKPVYVIDSKLRLPMTARILSTAKELVLFYGAGVNEVRVKELQARGVTLIQVARSSSGLDLKSILAVIGERGIQDLWIEAGAVLMRSLLRENLIDRLHLLVAPTFLPGDSLGVFGNSVSEGGTELDLRKVFPEVRWQQLASVGLCTLERSPR